MRTPLVYFLDLSKAFDTVNHSNILRKLYFYGKRGNCHKWLKIISQTEKIVKYNQVRSAVMPITIYINDLANCTNYLSTIFFADDTNLFISWKDISVIESNINRELIKVQNG